MASTLYFVHLTGLGFMKLQVVVWRSTPKFLEAHPLSSHTSKRTYSLSSVQVITIFIQEPNLISGTMQTEKSRAKLNSSQTSQSKTLSWLVTGSYSFSALVHAFLTFRTGLRKTSARSLNMGRSSLLIRVRLPHSFLTEILRHWWLRMKPHTKMKSAHSSCLSFQKILN